MPQTSSVELASKLRETLAQLEQAVADQSSPPSRVEQAALERWLQLAIQICMDPGDRILAERNVEEPPRARDIFTALEALGLLTREQATGMAKLVGVRNALIHDYGEFTPDTTPRSGAPGVAPA
jgi:uncharacterized protein YutE (UPF0331/DUF86 family)